MEQLRFVASLNSPPYFDRSNYSYWKTQMKFFLKIQDERVWNSVEHGWGPPLKLDVNRKTIGELKLKQEWDNLIMMEVKPMLGVTS